MYIIRGAVCISGAEEIGGDNLGTTAEGCFSP